MRERREESGEMDCGGEEENEERGAMGSIGHEHMKMLSEKKKAHLIKSAEERWRSEGGKKWGRRLRCNILIGNEAGECCRCKEKKHQVSLKSTLLCAQIRWMLLCNLFG